MTTSAIKTELALCAQRMGDVEEDIKEVKTTLYGNGKEGLTTTVKILDTKMNWILAILGTIGGLFAAEVAGRYFGLF